MRRLGGLHMHMLPQWTQQGGLRHMSHLWTWSSVSVSIGELCVSVSVSFSEEPWCVMVPKVSNARSMTETVRRSSMWLSWSCCALMRFSSAAADCVPGMMIGGVGGCCGCGSISGGRSSRTPQYKSRAMCGPEISESGGSSQGMGGGCELLVARKSITFFKVLLLVCFHVLPLDEGRTMSSIMK